MSELSAETELRLIDAVDGKISAVRTRQLDISFNELADMYQSGELLIQPEYQRLFRWSIGAQSRFIETLILELPIPPIFLMETEENVYELIDGLQRISSYLNFRGLLRRNTPNQDADPGPDDETTGPGALVLDECDIVTELNGRTYDSLPPALIRRLKRNFVRAEILRKESDLRLRYYMFKRLNSGGESLEPQEIRNCTIRLLGTRFNDVLLRLAADSNFKFCISTVAEAQLSKRYDQELILRFFAFLKWPHEYRHEVGDFMTEYMEAASDPDTADDPSVFDSSADPIIFEKTFAVLAAAARQEPEMLGGRLFGSVDRSGGIRGQFAVYHYEGLTLGIQPHLASLDPSNASQMKHLADKILAVKRDPDLGTHTGGGKNTARAFKARIEFFADQLSL